MKTALWISLAIVVFFALYVSDKRTDVVLATEPMVQAIPASGSAFMYDGDISQEDLGRMIVMVASGWAEWPTLPQCEGGFGEPWKEVPCMLYMFEVVAQPTPIRPEEESRTVYDPDFVTVPREREL